MNKIILWFKSNLKQTKIIFLVGVGLQIIFSILKASPYLFDLRLGSFVVYFAGTFISIAIFIWGVAGVISFIGYKVFGGLSGKYKRYLDYFAPTMLLLTFFMLYSAWKTEMYLRDF